MEKVSNIYYFCLLFGELLYMVTFYGGWYGDFTLGKGSGIDDLFITISTFDFTYAYLVFVGGHILWFFSICCLSGNQPLSFLLQIFYSFSIILTGIIEVIYMTRSEHAYEIFKNRWEQGVGSGYYADSYGEALKNFEKNNGCCGLENLTGYDIKRCLGYGEGFDIDKNVEIRCSDSAKKLLNYAQLTHLALPIGLILFQFVTIFSFWRDYKKVTTDGEEEINMEL